MEVTTTALAGVLIIQPKVFADARGFFLESYNKRVFRDATGLDVEFVQDNHSSSGRGVLRGLHYQIERAQGKLVRVIAGEVFDVAVDVRRSSPSFGKWTAVHLDARSKRMLQSDTALKSEVKGNRTSMVLLGTAAGLVLSVLGAIARDLTSLATLAVSLLMYITPVIYLQSTIESPVVRKLIERNPITYLVDVPRSMICLGRSDNLHVFFWLTCGAVALVAVGLRVFYLLEDLVAERL